MMSWIVGQWLKWRDIAPMDDRSSRYRKFNMARPLYIGRGFFSIFAAFLLAVGVSGCANFDAVKKFATLSSNAANHAAVTRDYIAALDRRNARHPPRTSAPPTAGVPRTRGTRNKVRHERGHYAPRFDLTPRLKAVRAAAGSVCKRS